MVGEKLVYRWDQIEPDSPIPLLVRKRLLGERIMLARVVLEPGCRVATHSHDSEQIAVVLEGLVVFTLGQEGSEASREVEVGAGEVVLLPSRLPHGVRALERTLILDVLAPPGAMGVDSQGADG